MTKKNTIYKRLKELLIINNTDESKKIIETLYKKNPTTWLKNILLENVLPEPLSIDFNRNVLFNFIHSLGKIIDTIEISDISKVVEMFISIFSLYEKLSVTTERFNELDFHSLPTVKQMQLLCIYIEDQARLGQNKLYEEYTNGKVFHLDDFIDCKVEDEKTGAKSSVIGSWEWIVDMVDINFKYIYYKSSMLDGIQFNEVTPYNNPTIQELFELTNIRLSVDNLWQNIKYRDWVFKKNDEEKIFVPPNMEFYSKESASNFRYQLFQQQYIMEILSSDIPIKINILNDIIEKLDIKQDISNSTWKPSFQNKMLEELLNANSDFEVTLSFVISELYKKTIDNIEFGQKGNKVTGRELIIACKFLYILSKVYLKQSWKLFDEESSVNSSYYSLTPILELDNICKLLSNAMKWNYNTCKNAISLFIYNTHNNHLDLYMQPLISIGQNKLILIPSLASSINLTYLFESHFSQWGISFNDRGPLFEEDIKNSFLKNNIPVENESIYFKASDGKEIQYDVVAFMDNHLLLIEAKCLKTPYTPKQTFTCWNEINKGVEQLKRRRKVVIDDWDTFRKKSTLELPYDPIEEKVVSIIFRTFLFQSSI